MIKLTEKPICFNDGPSAYWGHLYLGQYSNGAIAIVAGDRGQVGKLSVNLVTLADQLAENEFYVKLYGEGLYMNDPCMESGLFEVAGPEFVLGPHDAPFQKWKIKDEVWQKILSEIEDE